MAIGDSYATVAELAERLGGDIDGSYPAFLATASRAVERFTGRQFNKATVATARRFRAADCQRLPVDDFHTVTDLAVSVDGTVWDVIDVDPRPWDGIVDGQPGWPFFDLIAVDRTWPFDRRATITVTAQWGWPAVPEGIKRATLDVAAMMFTSGGSLYPVRSEMGDGYQVTYQIPGSGDMSAEMVNAAPYRRKRFGVA